MVCFLLRPERVHLHLQNMTGYQHYKSRIHQLQILLILCKSESESDVAIKRVL